jgi:hypothetical protein
MEAHMEGAESGLVGVLLIVLLPLALLGAPLLLFVFPVRRSLSWGVRVVAAISGALAAAWLSVIIAYVLWVGPGRSGVLASGFSPEGKEYCVIQSYQDMVEPYQVSLYVRDAEGAWRWHYLAHEDPAWRSVEVKFDGVLASVYQNGRFAREIPLSFGQVEVSTAQEQRQCPADFTIAEVLVFHNRLFGN